MPPPVAPLNRLAAILLGRGEHLRHLLRLRAEGAEQLLHVDGEDDVEFLRRVGGEDVGRGGTAHRLDPAGEVLVGNGVEMDLHLLAFLEVGAVEFTHLGHQFQLGKIENVGDGHAGLHLVAFAEVGDLHAREHEIGPVLPDRRPGRPSATAA